jgi:hypothetical protein
MANFQTHLTGGILISGAAVLGLHGAGWIAPRAAVGYFALGVVGSLLPDIDAAASRPVRAFFAVCAVALAFVVTLPLIGRLLALELVLVWAAVYVCVRYVVVLIFSRLTVHRGIWHSWLAIAVAALGTVDAAYWLLRMPSEVAWLSGLMIGIGYLTHLCLDELYSVDLLNSRVKRSFGTALKPLSLADPHASLGMFLAALVLLWLSPAHPWMSSATDITDAAVAALGVWMTPHVEHLRTLLSPVTMRVLQGVEQLGTGFAALIPGTRE